MPTKPLSLIALVLLIPVAVLAFFAVRSFSLENDGLTARRERLSRQRMEAASAQVLTRLETMGAEVLTQAHAAYATGGAEQLSRLARRRAFTYAFVFRQGEPFYFATALEHQYDIARTVQDRARALADTLTAAQRHAAALIQAGAGFTLLSCSRSAVEEDICVAIENADVMRTLKSALDLVARNTGLLRVGLVEPNGERVAVQDGAPLGTSILPLEGLLQGWHLRGDEPVGADRSPATAPLYLIAGSLIAAWAAMTWMLHRSAVLREEAAAARAGVIAQLAHELRTPLANLKLHNDLLRLKSGDAAAVRRYAGVLESEIGRLANLAENAIVVARGAMAKPKLETAVPDDCLRAIGERFEPTLAEARCSVRLALGAGRPCRFDRTSWERCVVNLIDNARKYAPGTDIDISTTLDAGVLRLEVSDRGPGVAADQRERIFEALDRGRATSASGFGLGLAAVRTLARQNGGDCRVEPLSPGSRFIFTMQAEPMDTADQHRSLAC